MQVSVVSNYSDDQNCYIVYKDSEAFVIDPGSDADVIIKRAGELGVKIVAILLTHCHYDHIRGLEKLREKTGAPLWVTAECSENVKDKIINVSTMFDNPTSASAPERILEDGENILIAGIDVKCIKTPGHTSCCTCFLVENSMFCGDTLFLRCVGRWDLPTGDGQTLINSVQNIIYKMDDDIVLYPGHGRATSIGYEKKYNLEIRENEVGSW